LVIRPHERRLLVRVHLIARWRSLEVDEATEAPVNGRLGAADSPLRVNRQLGDWVMREKHVAVGGDADTLCVK
jgi:hypothetical protein